MWYQEKCDLCGDCLVRCQYVDYDKEEAVQQIKELMEGKAAEILHSETVSSEIIPVKAS